MLKQSLMQLIKQKDEMQSVISKLTEQIQLIDKTKGFEKGLVDRQGFPREDLDFGQLSNYRNLKRKRNQLNNDHVKLMKQIQIKMFQYHASLPKVQGQQQIVQPSNFFKVKQQNKIEEKPIQKQKIDLQTQKQKYVIQYLTPFAKISLVQPKSPADLGGVRINDLLSQFSQVNIYTPDNIKQIPYQVKQNHEVKMIVMRQIGQQQGNKYQKIFTLKDKNQYAKLQLKIVPKKWEGRGLMGCKIDPL